MKKAKTTNAKNFFLGLVLIIAISLSLVCLCACNTNSDDDNSELMPEIQNIMDSTIAYCYTNNMFADFQFVYDNSIDILNIGHLGYVSIGIGQKDFTDIHNSEPLFSIIGYIFGSEAAASAQLERIKVEDPEQYENNKGLLLLKGNILFRSYEPNAYKTLTSATLPYKVSELPEYKFIKCGVKKSSSCIISGAFGFNADKTMIVSFSSTLHSISGNTYEEYNCISKNSCKTAQDWEQQLEYNTLEISDIGTKYTDDSYSKVKNDILYSYSKIKSGFHYKETQDGYALTDYYYDNYVENVYIPAEYNGKPVTEIDGAFYTYSYENYYNIHIPATIKLISSAFVGFSGVITVDFGNQNYYVESGCLIDKESKILVHTFGNAIIPSNGSVTSIADQAFTGNETVKNVIIPNSITHIGSNVFDGCSSLESVTIPNSVTYIGSSLFNEFNRNLKTIYCEAKSKPAEWNEWWLYGGSYQEELEKLVIWGYN